MNRDYIGGTLGEGGEGNAVGKGIQQVSVSLSDGERNQQRSQSLEDRVLDLERLIYGEPRWQEPGMIKRQQRQLYISQLNLGLNVAGFIVLIAILVYSWR